MNKSRGDSQPTTLKKLKIYPPKLYVCIGPLVQLPDDKCAGLFGLLHALLAFFDLLNKFVRFLAHLHIALGTPHTIDCQV